jgi:hypothetical protein
MFFLLCVLFFACVVNQQVLVRFPGFGVEEAEWIDVRTCTLRQRSVPYKATECADVHIWDPVLCYKVGSFEIDGS